MVMLLYLMEVEMKNFGMILMSYVQEASCCLDSDDTNQVKTLEQFLTDRYMKVADLKNKILPSSLERFSVLILHSKISLLQEKRALGPGKVISSYVIYKFFEKYCHNAKKI